MSNSWLEQKGALQKEFLFDDFVGALAFANQVGALAEAVNHHPYIELGWGRVKIILTTHSEGKVTDKDHQLAKQIDKING